MMRVDPKELLFFRVMVTPIVIQFVFWILAAMAVLAGLTQVAAGLSGGGAILVLTGLVAMVVGPLIVRIYCELIIILFRIYDELRALRTGQSPASPSVTTPDQPSV